MKFELVIAEADGSVLESMPSTAPQPLHELELEIRAATPSRLSHPARGPLCEVHGLVETEKLRS
jgi:hypothetical protein